MILLKVFGLIIFVLSLIFLILVCTEESMNYYQDAYVISLLIICQIAGILMMFIGKEK